MMAGNPNSWWSANNNTNSMQNLRAPSTNDQQQPTPHDPSPSLMSQQQQQTTTSLFPLQYVHGSDHDSFHHQYHTHEGCHDQVPMSWSQLLLGGFVNEQERYGQAASHHQIIHSRKLLEENCSWETQQYLNNISPRITTTTTTTLPHHDHHHHIKEEVMTQHSCSNLLYNNSHHQHHEDQDVHEDQGGAATYRQLLTTNWSHMIPPASSPKSCVTSLSSGTTNTADRFPANILDFSNNKRLHHDDDQKNNQHADHSYECNSTAATTGGGVAAAKKARVQPSSTPPLKVRKEKLGDRITALHQLVSPFGKTDTASVLLEAIGYIRFLQGQIEALSSPYLSSSPAKTQQQSVHGERNCLFPNHPGQLLNDSCLKRRGGAANQDYKEKEGAKDLKSRGLCLVPISCTHLVGNDNGADYWAPSFGGGF